MLCMSVGVTTWSSGILQRGKRGLISAVLITWIGSNWGEESLQSHILENSNISFILLRFWLTVLLALDQNTSRLALLIRDNKNLSCCLSKYGLCPLRFLKMQRSHSKGVHKESPSWASKLSHCFICLSFHCFASPILSALFSPPSIWLFCTESIWKWKRLSLV